MMSKLDEVDRKLVLAKMFSLVIVPCSCLGIRFASSRPSGSSSSSFCCSILTLP